MSGTPGEKGDGSRREDGRDQTRREFRDAEGRVWVALESPIPASDWTSADEDAFIAGYGVGWLRFESGDRQRLLRLYPKHWHVLSDASLHRLFQHARNATSPK